MEQQGQRHSHGGSPSGNRRIKLNVGGKLFETTSSTLESGGPDSLLAAFCSSRHQDDGDEEEDHDDRDPCPIFIDRDPEIFSVLLSLLRTSRLPSTARHRFTTQELAEEALYYGIDPLLRAAMAPPPLSGPDASLSTTVRPAADALPTALAPGPDDGSLWVAHGGQISAYDWSLSHAATVRTHVETITSVRRAWGDVAAVGSYLQEEHTSSSSSPGLHFYDVLSGGRHVGSVHWRDPTDPRVYKARVASVATAGTSDPTIYAAFECPHRENAVLAVDKQTLQVAAEIGRQSGGSIKTAVATKLSVVPAPGSGHDLVFASVVSAGAFGYSGYMRLWDPRTREAVWETVEPGPGSSSGRFGDSFSDADADHDTGRIYKVCWKSGDVGFADLRMLSGGGGSGDPWLYLEERSAALRVAGGGEGAVVCCYKGQVFVGREGGLEAWTRVVEDDGGEGEGEEERRRKGWTREMRRNFVDREEDSRRGVVRRMEGGGERLFVCREDVEGVEVWESSDLSGAVAAVEL